MMDEFDDLDRALFALPLEEPPAELRRAILAVTVDAPKPLRTWEAVAVTTTVTAGAWLTAAVFGTPGAAGMLESLVMDKVQLLLDPATGGWICAGLTTAFWLSQLSLQPLAGSAPRRDVRAA